ncbi:MAG: HemK/PrmC family methyltransferase [Gordonibacter sp.]|nr:HemK/PrmC family methyltransferase [Gordonibacter sp.]
MAENDIWTIKAALDWTAGYLERKGDENPRISAQWLLCEACGMRRIDLYTHFEQPLTLEERDVLRGYVTRRGAGEPLQYITGEVAFRHITVKVRSGVLIPRPETEVLVSEALALLPAAPRPRAADDRMSVGTAASLAGVVSMEGTILGPEDGLLARAVSLTESTSSSTISDDQALPRNGEIGGGDQILSQVGGVGESGRAVQLAGPLVADLCTGSGCIACSIAYEHSLAHVVATDIAPEAVALASENASALGLDDRVRVLACDLGEGIDTELMGHFDLVVSNPPYVPTVVLDKIPREVAEFEPTLALDGGVDGLDIFRRLLPFCARALKPGGAFAFELHETCLDKAAHLAQEAGFTDVRVVDDLTRRPRVLVARRSL